MRSEESRHKSRKKFSFYGTVYFLTFFSTDPRKQHSKIPKTYLSTAFWSWYSWEFSKIRVFVFLIFFLIFWKKKISILWYSELLDMFLFRCPKTAFKNIQSIPLYSILKLTFLEIFKNESFCFSQFSGNFFLTYAWVS